MWLAMLIVMNPYFGSNKMMNKWYALQFNGIKQSYSL